MGPEDEEVQDDQATPDVPDTPGEVNEEQTQDGETVADGADSNNDSDSD